MRYNSLIEAFMGPDITAFFDEATNTISYIVCDPNGSACAVIDSVLDFDFASGRTDTRSANKLINLSLIHI